MSWPKLIVASIIAALVIGSIGFATSKLLRQEAVPTVTLTDGTQLRIERATVGTNHVFSADPIWKETLRRKLPVAWQSLLGKPAFNRSATTHASELVLWLTQFDPVTGRSFLPKISSLEVIDDHGYAHYCGASGSSSSPGAPPVSHHYIPVFPRRQEVFAIRFNDGKTRRELTLRNPAVWRGSEWQPSPLPQTKQVGDLEVTLPRIVPRGPVYGGRYYYDFPFEVKRGGRREPFWEADSLIMTDATGNQNNYSLSPFEPAWNLQAKLIRSAQSKFSAAEVVRLTHSAAPEPGEVLTLTNISAIATNGIAFAALTGPGQFDFADGICVAAAPWERGMRSTGGQSLGTTNWSDSFTSPETALTLILRNFPDDKIIRVRARDANGRVHSCEGSGRVMSSWSETNKTEIRRYHFKSLTNAVGELDFELIAQTPLQVEFLVSPPKPDR